MHEIGMLFKTAEMAVQYAKENNIDEIKTIFLEIGELAGVLPDIFTEYFDYVAQKFPQIEHADLQIRIIAGEAMCMECHNLYNVMKNQGECPQCHSKMKTILSGRDVELVNIGY